MQIFVWNCKFDKPFVNTRMQEIVHNVILPQNVHPTLLKIICELLQPICAFFQLKLLLIA